MAVGKKFTASLALCAGCSKEGQLAYYCQQTSDNAEQGHTFYQCSSQDHVSADVVCSFGLTGDRFQRAFTDVTYTDTSSDSSYTCTDCATCLSQASTCSSLQQNC